MIKINDEFINTVSEQAKQSERKRKNYNFHKKAEDTLQRMLNAMEPGTYIQPHKHENPDKVEAFFSLKGKFLVVEFDDDGRITEYVVLDPKAGSYGCEIAPKTWHMIICLEPGTVAYEVKDGPYNPSDDKNFAPWSPKEGEDGADEYINHIISQTIGNQ
jgi:cupin fold WbuC family metalloprotein